jgi:hypothetical protein
MGMVTVKVEGDDQEQVSGVAAGVMVGLENTGFKNVKLGVEYEASNMEAIINRDRSLDAPSTLLATLKMRNPDLFEQPVMVHVPVVKPTGGLTVYATEDNIILEEKDEHPHHQPMRLDPAPQDDIAEISIKFAGRKHVCWVGDTENVQACFIDGKCYALPGAFVEGLTTVLEPHLAKD